MMLSLGVASQQLEKLDADFKKAKTHMVKENVR
jgi:hypothetical protein